MEIFIFGVFAILGILAFAGIMVYLFKCVS